VLHGALAYLECRLRTAEDAGDHTIFIAEVEDVVVRDGDPLLFFRGKYRAIGAEAYDSSTTTASRASSEFDRSSRSKH
jgi:flavin reductase (DIM6/NTAB) family NADH-FMN oxidoreductase RutF